MVVVETGTLWAGYGAMKNVLLVVAHPDDESMYLLKFVSPGVHALLVGDSRNTNRASFCVVS